MEQYLSNFEEACAKLGKPTQLPDVSVWPERLQNHLVALYKLDTILEVNNDGWKANMADTDEYKYYPWFDINPDDQQPSGFGLSYYCYDYAYSCSSLGARLYYKDRETAKYAGTQFTELYADMILIPR